MKILLKIILIVLFNSFSYAISQETTVKVIAEIVDEEFSLKPSSKTEVPFLLEFKNNYESLDFTYNYNAGLNKPIIKTSIDYDNIELKSKNSKIDADVRLERENSTLRLSGNIEKENAIKGTYIGYVTMNISIN